MDSIKVLVDSDKEILKQVIRRVPVARNYVNSAPEQFPPFEPQSQEFIGLHSALLTSVAFISLARILRVMLENLVSDQLVLRPILAEQHKLNLG